MHVDWGVVVLRLVIGGLFVALFSLAGEVIVQPVTQTLCAESLPRPERGSSRRKRSPRRHRAAKTPLPSEEHDRRL
jgi:hypothetical protein